MVVAAALSDQHRHNSSPRRPPLLPSSANGGAEEVVLTSRKPKSRQVTSRYLSSSSSTSTSSTSSATSNSSSFYSSSASSNSSSRRSVTPFPSPATKRSHSVERRRPATPRTGVQLTDTRPTNADGSLSVASKILFTSTRSLAVSFQGESFSLPVSKTKAVPPPQSVSYARKTTPERRRNTPSRRGGGDHVENSKPVDQHRWPARTRQTPNSLSRSLDCGGDKKKLSGSSNVVRALQQSLLDEGAKPPLERSANAVLVKSIQFPLDIDSIDGSVASSVPSDLISSDTESVSSGGNSGSQECGVARLGNGQPRGISVPARFWQETNSRLRRLEAPTKLNSSKRFSGDNPVSSPRTVTSHRGMSPFKGAVRPASPSKLMLSSTSSPSRGVVSPLRTRNTTAGPGVGQLSEIPSVLSFAARGKMGENRIMDAHLLRLFHNRQLQWRLINARADAAMLVQRSTVEKNLYDASVTMSRLRDSVTAKRVKLQFLRQNLKLISLLKGQMIYLEQCGLLDREHSSSLSGAVEALEASTLRLPVVGGARADIQSMKDAVGSAVDVMQAMASSICSSLSKVEEVNNFAVELAQVTRRERELLDQCRDLLSTLAAMQVNDCSLRTHILQVKHVPTSLTPQV